MMGPAWGMCGPSKAGVSHLRLLNTGCGLIARPSITLQPQAVPEGAPCFFWGGGAPRMLVLWHVRHTVLVNAPRHGKCNSAHTSQYIKFSLI